MPSPADEVPPSVNIDRPDPPAAARQPPLSPRDRLRPSSASVDLDALDRLSDDAVTSVDAVHFRRLVAAGRALAEAEREMDSAVAAARGAGDSWTIIAAALGQAVEATRARFDRT